jgi:hypothetical protein
MILRMLDLYRLAFGDTPRCRRAKPMDQLTMNSEKPKGRLSSRGQHPFNELSVTKRGSVSVQRVRQDFQDQSYQNILYALKL